MRNLTLPSNLPSNLSAVQLIDITDKLPINPKNSWAQLAGVRSAADLTTIALHHDAWKKKNRAGVSDLDFASEIAQEHIDYTGYDPTGEGGMPYHIWIRNGRAYQCNDLLDRVYGVGSNNGYTVHICVSGEYYATDVLTDADRAALYVAVLAVKAALPSITTIKPHKDFPQNHTDCPGYDAYKVAADIKSIEMQMKYAQTDANKKAVSFRIANQILYLYNLAQGKNSDGSAAAPGDVEWGINSIMDLKEFMDGKGIQY